MSIEVTMVKELTYEKNSVILDTWQVVQKNPRYHEEIGTSLYHKFFKSCPKAMSLFGWPDGTDPDSYEVLKSKRFMIQASLYVSLLDTVVDMLGPATEMLEEILIELGEKHWKIYGVTHDFYEPMGQALMATFREKLGDFFTPEVEDIWLGVWIDLAADMMKKELEYNGLQESKKSNPKVSSKSQATKISVHNALSAKRYK